MMEIKRRIGLPRTRFHVMNRGARKVAIFADDRDRELFVKLLGIFARKHGVKIISWCLMPNHYHLEMECEGTPLSRMMHDLDGTYAHAYNERHDTSGALFQGPFKSMAIRDAKGLAYVSRYIHANSRDLGIRPENYRWSSCRAYLGKAPKPSWLDPWPVFDVLKQPGRSPEACYKDYLRAVPPRRRRKRKKGEEFADFTVDYVRHVEEICTEWMLGLGGLLGHCSLQTFVCWAAQQLFEIPPRFVDQFYGYQDVRIVKSRRVHFEQRLEANPELRRALNRLIGEQLKRVTKQRR